MMTPAKTGLNGNGDMWTSLVKWAVGAGSASVFVVALLWILVEYQMKPAQMRMDRQDERTEKLVDGLQLLLVSQVQVNAEIQASVRKMTDADAKFIDFMGVVSTQHEQQTRLLERADEAVLVNQKLLTDATEMMRPVPAQREESNRLLQELIDEVKKKQ
jgi:hypothetical protein